MTCDVKIRVGAKLAELVGRIRFRRIKILTADTYSSQDATRPSRPIAASTVNQLSPLFRISRCVITYKISFTVPERSRKPAGRPRRSYSAVRTPRTQELLVAILVVPYPFLSIVQALINLSSPSSSCLPPSSPSSTRLPPCPPQQPRHACASKSR